MPATLAAAILFYRKLLVSMHRRFGGIFTQHETYSVEVIHHKDDPNTGEQAQVELPRQLLLGGEEFRLCHVLGGLEAIAFRRVLQLGGLAMLLLAQVVS